MSTDDKPLIRRLVVLAASAVLPPPVVGVGEVTFDFANKRFDEPTARVNRNLKKVTPSATAQERSNGIQFAIDAIVRAGLSQDQLAYDDFDPERISRRIEPFLTKSLTDREHHVAWQAVRLSIKAAISEAKKTGEDLRAFARQSHGQLTSLQNAIEDLRTESQIHAPFANRSRQIVDSHRAGDVLHRDLYVGSLPQTTLAHFSFDWRVAVKESIDVLRTIRSYDAPVEALNALGRVPLIGTYPSVWLGLQSDATRKAFASIEDFLARDRNGHLRSICAEPLKFLQGQISAPQFSLAFVVSGSWGSGKTRWLDRVAEICPDEGWLPVHVECKPLSVNGLQAEVFASFEETIGMRIGSVPELTKTLRGRGGSIVLIDDWDTLSGRQAGRLRELEVLIERLSDLKIRWAVAADESALPKMLAGGGERFWSRYGCSVSEATPARNLVSGWLLLDDQNESNAVGLKILEKGVAGGLPIEVTMSGEASLASSIRRSLSSPLVALLKMDLDPSIPLDEVHVISLMESYWHLMKGSLSRYDGPADDALDAVCEAIGLARLKGRSAAVGDVASSLAPNGYLMDEWRSALKAAIICLRDRNIVSVVGPDDQLLPSPTVDLLWGFLISRVLEPCPPDRGFEGLPYARRDLLAIADLSKGDDLNPLKAVLRFVLVAHALEVGQASKEASQPYVRWLRNPGLPKDVLWEAASVLPSATQTRLIAEAMNIREVGPDEPFWALRMLRLADLRSSRQALANLHFVGRVGHKANAEGLQEYVLLVVEGIIPHIRWSVSREAVEALSLIHGIATPQTAEWLSDAVVSELHFETRKSRLAWLRTLTHFLTIVPNDPSEDGKEPTFWLSLTQRSMSAVAEKAGVTVILEMLEAGVFVDSARGQQMSKTAGHFLRRSAHVAFGHTRSTDQRAFDQFALELIKAELQGASAERQVIAALFGIRHSVSTRSGIVTVDRPLRTHLALLKASPYINSDMQKWVATIRVRD